MCGSKLSTIHLYALYKAEGCFVSSVLSIILDKHNLGELGLCAGDTLRFLSITLILQICHKCPLGLEEELIRFWSSKVKVSAIFPGNAWREFLFCLKHSKTAVRKFIRASLDSCLNSCLLRSLLKIIVYTLCILKPVCDSPSGCC